MFCIYIVYLFRAIKRALMYVNFIYTTLNKMLCYFIAIFIYTTLVSNKMLLQEHKYIGTLVHACTYSHVCTQGSSQNVEKNVI